MPQKAAVSAGAIILRDIDGELKIALAHRNRVTKPWKIWVIPKGHVEEGETIEQAVHREIFEETGLSGVQLIKYLGNVQRSLVRENGNTAPPKTVHYYLAYLAGTLQPTMPTDERFEEVGWFPPEQVLELIPYDVERGFFKEQLAPLFQSAEKRPLNGSKS